MDPRRGPAVAWGMAERVPRPPTLAQAEDDTSSCLLPSSSSPGKGRGMGKGRFKGKEEAHLLRMRPFPVEITLLTNCNLSPLSRALMAIDHHHRDTAGGAKKSAQSF